MKRAFACVGSRGALFLSSSHMNRPCSLARPFVLPISRRSRGALRDRSAAFHHRLAPRRAVYDFKRSYAPVPPQIARRDLVASSAGLSARPHLRGAGAERHRRHVRLGGRGRARGASSTRRRTSCDLCKSRARDAAPWRLRTRQHGTWRRDRPSQRQPARRRRP